LTICRKSLEAIYDTICFVSIPAYAINFDKQSTCVILLNYFIKFFISYLDCESHVTFGDEFLRIWPMQKNNDTQDIRFYVRASHNIAIQLYQNPGALFPCFTVI